MVMGYWDKNIFTKDQQIIISINLGILRRSRGLSVEYVANQIGISKCTVYKYEEGVSIRHGMLERFAKFYGVDLDFLSNHIVSNLEIRGDI